MVKKDNSMEMQQQEAVAQDDMERTRSRRRFIPKADIFETESEIVLLADIPGANEKSVDITLEKSVLTVDAYISPTRSEDYQMAYAEYEEGDYQRSFRLSDEIARESIEATVRDGVLRLRLPKAKQAQARKIAVTAG
jgi:HSP20 family protein